ncbi:MULTISPECIES: cell division protein FtsQ/DivIB [unclassified Undibacterium]|uniref:cell division protein FtsQ/DivIB n=1 Tax=unclassified Undibacterium TaxID=2630295 RepID=UPI002AC959CE|nr:MULTISPECIES: cell division protein FtsQ/DivIB [unclassified Undibacterium]MEB0138660.1 cell division protein FtsQ/DivIB [Undibacterium sp. CCC2.1]MEB0171461.1 cell division protein FtsQ/DivIB [Undibacterium sp. CCC1.1]MEB0175791.1 cell division protein FtsQ/DivIB [Undibacterium sp. CCC3.4]MEB0214380.1 cell division protein FtsQ/DivIB [Undibacterium sp. 5I2]WPX44250.1 cell division protein FtsQ/DivIB [Undibacterium sp. CCC3.4]
MWQDIKLMNNTANALLGAVLLALMLSGVWWVIRRPMFTLTVIQVAGSNAEPLRHVNPLTIRNTALPKIRGNFFTANLDNVRAAFESVPWVRRASVQREWPNKLSVTLEEHVAIGTWGDDGQLISVAGEVFTANLAEAEEDADLIALAGPDGSSREVLQQYVQLKTWFARIGLAPEAVKYSNRYAWSVKLNNGMQVELGRVQDGATIKGRVDKLLTVYPQLIASLQDSIESVDMRYPNGLALKSSHSAVGMKQKKKL